MLESRGNCVLRSLTVAKHHGPYEHDPNDEHRPPEATVRVCLQILVELALGLGLGLVHVFTNAQAVMSLEELFGQYTNYRAVAGIIIAIA